MQTPDSPTRSPSRFRAFAVFAAQHVLGLKARQSTASGDARQIEIRIENQALKGRNHVVISLLRPFRA